LVREISFITTRGSDTPLCYRAVSRVQFIADTRPIPPLPMTGGGKAHAGTVLKRFFKYEFLPERIDLKITIYAEGIDVPMDDSPVLSPPWCTSIVIDMAGL
jgi:hypothetical protein